VYWAKGNLFYQLIWPNTCTTGPQFPLEATRWPPCQNWEAG
jgi:hypothetical protein